MIDSGESLTTFNPKAIPMQWKVTRLIRKEWDYSKGNLEILLSGSYGSSKSILIAHLVITHCLLYTKARACLARRGMPDLKDTIFKEILEHLENDDQMEEGKHYNVNHTKAYIKFKNGSEIISRSWSDKKYKKGRSLKLSFLAFEELTENDHKDKEAFDTLKARLRRIKHVPENVLIAATNPDSPRHWVYQYFMESNLETIKVFYSRTEDNPFLDPIYVKQLKASLDAKMAKRMLEGLWIEIDSENVYYNYDPQFNFKDHEYKINPHEPIYITHDFNIGKNKPMSCALGQYLKGNWHWFKSYHVEGARTLNIMEEMANDGVFQNRNMFIVNGDATGRSRDTRSIQSDYDIIEEFLSNFKRKDRTSLEFEIDVGKSNPPIKKRHELVNAACKNMLEEVRFFVYDKWIDKGMRLTGFLKDSLVLEDDSLPEQHVTTAIGYAVYRKYLDDENYTASRQL